MIILSNFVYLKMYPPKLFLMSILLRIADGFTVKGPSGPLVVPLGGSVLLPCSVESLSSLEDLEVEWKRSDSQTLIHLYQDGDIRPEAQHEDYHDRAHFFTENIKQGNFSLLMKNVTAEDEGQYTCTVHSGQESGETVLEIKDVERLIVSGSDRSISVYVGEDVTLNCSVDSHIPPEHFEEVSWKKTDKDEHITVLLYQNNYIFPDASDELYRDRVEFFSDEIHRGNFSLRLKRVRTEDKGLYMCHVFAGRFSDNTTVILQQLGLSGFQIMVLILCISACGSALLFCSLIYCRNNTDTALRLQMFLVFCPNIIMFFAFVFWGVSEGSVNETVFCCALYIVRPLMLLFTAPYKEQFTGKLRTHLNWSLRTDYISFSTVVYSVLFKSAWEKSLNYTASDRAMIISLFVIVLLLCLIYIIYVLLKITVKLSQRIDTIFLVVAGIIFYVLPSLQFVLLFFTFESATGGFFIVAVLPVITSATRYNWNIVCGDQMGCSPLVRRLVWIVLMCFMNAVLIYFYITALEKENDRVGWACTIGFLQVIWTVWNCLMSFQDWGFTRITAVYVFGSVGVVIFSAVGLMTELVLKTLNGEGLVGDLRIIVFSSESLFTALVVIIIFLSPWIKKDLQCCQIPAKCKKAAPTESPQNQNAAGDQEMNPLNPQKTDKNREADETQPDSQT
ncbi:uncharacterized protein LOC130566511 [Triplophysa rosa]|uniref:uncharacterized protein LOC130566511 n=1 Tax=Triplophysa rosa TaxID=992332 RepID=UPI00254612F3|nr:uncharacterized protein LOC130566511 [Triplophysa rosa]